LCNYFYNYLKKKENEELELSFLFDENGYEKKPISEAE
jgi:hypothetical protein